MKTTRTLTKGSGPALFRWLWEALAPLMFAWAMYKQYSTYLPYELRHFISSRIMRYTASLLSWVSPYQEIAFDEYTVSRHLCWNGAYRIIETYLSEVSSTKVNRLKGSYVYDRMLVFKIANAQEVADEYGGVAVCWVPGIYTSSKYSKRSEDVRFFRLLFHRRDREFVTSTYLNHVFEEGKAVQKRRRVRRLYTNTSTADGSWSQTEFKHPGKFQTLAMHPQTKQKIHDDLTRFKEAKHYYQKIGKAWKRGYLLYGPPGTGKSTMVAAMANFLEYDVYDLELTAVKDNVLLRKLLIETASKSIILIEDIDCSLNLTGERKNVKDKKVEGKGKGTEKDKKGSEVTLSGLLNFIDGIWSSCGEERIIIFTTNYINKLDPALIRRGRMDMHIEMSYCCFEGFKVLAKNYLDIESHPLFERVERLLGETKVTPADVAENLMPKSSDMDVEACLLNLITELERAGEKEAKETKTKTS